MLLLHNIPHPHILFYQDVSYHALDQIHSVHCREDRDYTQIRIPAEYKCRRHTDHAHEEAVKEECNDRLSAGPECEISRMQESVFGRGNGLYDQEHGRQMLRRIVGVVDLRKQRRGDDQKDHDRGSYEH